MYTCYIHMISMLYSQFLTPVYTVFVTGNSFTRRLRSSPAFSFHLYYEGFAGKVNIVSHDKNQSILHLWTMISRIDNWFDWLSWDFPQIFPYTSPDIGTLFCHFFPCQDTNGAITHPHQVLTTQMRALVAYMSPVEAIKPSYSSF